MREEKDHKEVERRSRNTVIKNSSSRKGTVAGRREPQGLRGVERAVEEGSNVRQV